MSEIEQKKSISGNYIYELEFTVRDYECDLQGILNNSVYQNYLEHTRHEFLLDIGISFADLYERGVLAVVARVNLAYKGSLRSRDRCVCRLRVEEQGVKQVFYQDIYKLPENTLCLQGKVTTVASVNGKLVVCEEINRAIEQRVELIKQSK